MDEAKMTALEKDILTEVGSVCAGNATTALVQILSRKIELELPALQIVAARELPRFLACKPEDVIVGLHARILGNAKGNALLVFLKNEAFTILDILMGTASASDKPSSFTELAISALKEVGNIVVASYLTALSTFVGICAFPSTVTFTSGEITALVNLAFYGLNQQEDLKLIIIEATLRESKRDLSGRFFIIFEKETIKDILTNAKRMINYKEGQE